MIFLRSLTTVEASCNYEAPATECSSGSIEQVSAISLHLTPWTRFTASFRNDHQTTSDSGVDFGPVDVVKNAEAFGAKGLRSRYVSIPVKHDPG